MSLPQQVGVARGMLRKYGMIDFRSHFLQDKNFPQDIKEMKDAGQTPDQIWEYYWGCPEFVVFWEDLELNEDHLRGLIYDRAEEQPSEASPVA
jgi:hypothetical protein